MHHHHRQKELKNFGTPLLEIVADINGIIGGIALYPQVVKAFHEQTVEGLSGLTVFIIAINSVIWLYYAFKKKDHTAQNFNDPQYHRCFITSVLSVCF